MTTTKHLHSKTSAVLAILFLLPPLIMFIMWSSIGLHSGSLNANEKINSYLEMFPRFMQNLAAINILSIIFCLVSIYYAARSFSKRLVSMRVLMMIVVLVAVFIILFDLYLLAQEKVPGSPEVIDTRIQLFQAGAFLQKNIFQHL